MELRNFYAGMLHLNEMYGIAMLESDYENMALHAWDHIGNKNYRLYVHHACVIEDNKIILPCNVDIVEAVLKPGEDHWRTDGVNSYATDLLYASIENYIEGWNISSDAFYLKGTYLNYQQVGDTLYLKDHHNFNGPIHHATILYKGVLADEVGLPMLNFKEVDAIAKYCAWIVTQKQAMITRDQATFQIAQMLQKQWQSACDDARTPIFLNQNDMDRILNAQSSWDRKRYNISYKPIR